MTTEHWVEYHIPGAFFSESSRKKLTSYSVEEAMKHFPQYAFAFHLFDVETRTGTLEDGEKIEKKKEVNESGRYYPGAELYNLEQLNRLNDSTKTKSKPRGEFETLVSNMKCNEWDLIVKTRCGNWQPFDKKDRVIAETKKLGTGQRQIS